jgi:hypothetical protein
LGARRTQWIRLIFDVPPCTSATGYLEVTRAIVHYRLLGATFAQSVPLDPRPTIRCR